MTPSPLPSQLEDILNQAGYDDHSHSLDMILHVPAGVRASKDLSIEFKRAAAVCRANHAR